MRMKRIPLYLIYGNPDQPRKTFDEKALAELAASIRENELKQPITVRPDGAGRFMIVMGERRFRAHQLLQAEDAKRWRDILCHVSAADDQQLAIDAIIENDQRVDISPLEQARSYQRMLDEFGLTVDELATKLGKAPHRITERTALLKLTDENQKLLERGYLTPGQAWYVMQLSARGQTQMVQAINKGLCPNTQALRATFEAIQAAESQVVMFAVPDDQPTKEQRQIARSFDAKVEQIAALLRAGIEDNEIKAVAKVDPNRASQVADLFGAMQKDLRRLEEAFRKVAVEQTVLAA